MHAIWVKKVKAQEHMPNVYSKHLPNFTRAMARTGVLMRRLRLLSLEMEREREAEEEGERVRRAVGFVPDSLFCVGFAGTHGKEFGGSARLL